MSREPDDRMSEHLSDHDGCMPKVTFSTFILSLTSSALVALGEVPNPETGRIEKNLPMARHTIDILSMLDQKTRSDRDIEENRLMESVLYDLRMKYLLHHSR